jgi:rhodanese-related sulfurtransferase
MSGDRSNKSKQAAAALKARGIFHGKRLSKPYPNSGGLTMTWEGGSAAYRRQAKKGRK